MRRRHRASKLKEVPLSLVLKLKDAGRKLMGRQRLSICTLFQGIRSLGTETGAASDDFIPKWLSCKSPEAFLPLPYSQRYHFTCSSFMHSTRIHHVLGNDRVLYSARGKGEEKDNTNPWDACGKAGQIRHNHLNNKRVEVNELRQWKQNTAPVPASSVIAAWLWGQLFKPVTFRVCEDTL